MFRRKIGVSGQVGAEIWREIAREEMLRLLHNGQAQFIGYKEYVERSFIPGYVPPSGFMTQLPNQGDKYFRFQRQMIRPQSNDTKQALLGRYVYWLCTSTNSEPVHHVRFECATYNGNETTTVSATGNDGAQKYWTIHTAVHTFGANDTVNRVHLENAGSVEYAEYPDNGDPAEGQAVNNGDVLTINWKREVNGTPNASTKAGTLLPLSLMKCLESTNNIASITEEIAVSYDAGSTWKRGSASKIAGGTLTDDYVQFETELSPHGEGSSQTIDRSSLNKSGEAIPSVSASTCWNGSASESWPDGQSKIVRWRIDVDDYAAGEIK